MLNERQRAFCLEYVKTQDATNSAKSAGYSAKTASSIGYQLLRQPTIAAEIARLTGRTEKKSQLTAERVVQELSNIAFFDPATMYDASGKLLSIKEMPEETRRAIAGVEEHLTHGTKLRISSKLGSLELAAKLLGMVKEQQTQQQAIQITIAAPPALPVVDVERRQLLPEWE